MNKHNTILGQMLELVSRSLFDKLVKKHKTEYKAKGLTSWTQFVSMLFGQISGQHGLRSIETGMNSQQSAWYHLGLRPGKAAVCRSSLSYANQHRSSDLFKGLFESLLANAQRIKSSHGFRFKNPLYSIDATVIDLCLKLFPWADFRKGKGGIKLTVKLDHRGKIPCFMVVSNAREHDRKKIGDIPVEAGDMVVFDRGYNDYGYFLSLCERKVSFVTRLKRNAKYRRVKKNHVPGKGTVISDYEITVTSLESEQHFRKILVRDPVTKKQITLLTNNFTLAASTIADVYKDRWQIELFFKAIKQNLKIKRFYGNSKNAVMTQIWIAMICYLLFYILKNKARNSNVSFTNFISVIRTMLFQRISLYEWLKNYGKPNDPVQITSPQLEFSWGF